MIYFYRHKHFKYHEEHLISAMYKNVNNNGKEAVRAFGIKASQVGMILLKFIQVKNNEKKLNRVTFEKTH